MNVYYADNFVKSAQKLNTKQQAKLTGLIVLLSKNPFHSKLHTKALSGEFVGIYSFRISRDWRAVFRFLSPEEIVLIEVDHRKDIYR